MSLSEYENTYGTIKQCGMTRTELLVSNGVPSQIRCTIPPNSTGNFKSLHKIFSFIGVRNIAIAVIININHAACNYGKYISCPFCIRILVYCSLLLWPTKVYVH